MKSIIMSLVLVFGGLAARAGLEEALRSVPAPGGEYVRMPARYVIEKIETAARNSGDPELGAFSVHARVEGLANERININMETMNLLEALEAVAKATKARLVLEEGGAVLADPSTVPLEVSEGDLPAAAVATAKEGGVEFSDVDSALIFVRVGDGSGSGFVAEMEGEMYVFSNQHNFMGAREMELRAMHGGLVQFESFEFNRTRDLVRFKLNKTDVGDLSALRFAGHTPAIGQNVVIYGNSAGGGVATELRGEVLGVGPRDIEVDAAFVPGNSGSPIINEEGEVIGVATYLTFDLEFAKGDKAAEAFKGTRFRKSRRYGVRVPTDGWVEVSMRKFLAQSYEVEDAKNALWITQVLTRHWMGDEDAEAAAQEIMNSYGSNDRRVEPPLKFHSAKVEEDIRMMVKAYKRNHGEFRDLVYEMELDKRALAKFRRELEKGNSNPKVQRVDYHIRTSMLSRVKRMQDELRQHVWMSGLLEETAEPLEELAGVLISELDSEGDLISRIKAVM